jgi:hypothetical protein
MSQPVGRSKAFRYVLYGFILWVMIDLGTAGGFRMSYFRVHGPLLLLFYLGFPAAFAYLIFQRSWSGWKLFLATAVTIILVEGVFTGNPFILSFPLMLVGIPLALCVYSPLTYFPLWIVNQEMGKHRAIRLSDDFVALPRVLRGIRRREHHAAIADAFKGRTGAGAFTGHRFGALRKRAAVAAVEDQHLPPGTAVIHFVGDEF